MYQKLIDLGLKKGLSDIEIFVSKAISHELSVYKQEVDSNIKSNVESVTIKGIYNGKKASVRTEYLNEKNYEKMIDLLIESAKALTVSEPAVIFEGSKEYPVVEDSLFDFDAVDTKTKIDFLKTIENEILAHESTSNVESTSYYAVDSKTSIINSKGLNLHRHHTYAYAYSVGVFQKDDDIKTAYDIMLVKDYKDFDAKKIASETITKGVKQIGGKSIKSGAYDVVFSQEMFANILSVFYSIFTGEAAYRNLTKLKDKVGVKIATQSFTVIDDPLHEQANFKVPFDDEGVACFKQYLIKEGIFQGFTHNLKTAAIFNTNPTGNGFSGGISPTNLYVEPGKNTFDDMISPITDGVYITDLVGLHAGVSSVSGDFNLQAGGFKITNGKIDHPVKMIVLSGNFFKMLENIEGIASDLKFTLSGIGSPSIYVSKLMIGGQES